MRKSIIVILCVLWFLSTIAVTSWYVMDYQNDKCLSVSSNDYYYTDESCWTILERPIVAFIEMFVVFGLLLAIPFGLPILVSEIL